ncbi:MAG: UDP-N-acetylmuramoyl-tripeptide--D-alanyl-D-alanine ligase [Lactobacillus sp.]|jgi:UDP-N-acetylmuramoyl-tripeptide--D-alanyl-D-alanine ligase|nr:UDP-N-acetylmuramoyl-tripeptide--D-alanyl-D-alanine ligase [Lactobacillus sp.]
MMKISSKKIAEIVGSISNVINEDVEKITTDSRTVFKGDLFVAIKGEKFDGHEFVADVMDKGAAFVIVEKLIADVPAIRQILVSDTLKAYGDIASYVRSQYKGIVVGLTGSSGKTTLKEELKFVLKKFGPISATEGNFNNHIGVPKSLIDLDMNSKYAIIEMGMAGYGEISHLTAMVKPDIAIVNNVYPMHLEFFPEEGVLGIAKAKAEIFEGLPKGGTAIINNDTNHVDVLVEKAKKADARIVLFGRHNVLSQMETNGGWSLECDFDNEVVNYELSARGEHVKYNSLCVLSVVRALNLDVKKAADFLKDFETPDGRGRLHELKLGDGGKYLLIDDSYSGQPDAVIIGLNALNSMKTDGKKIAVLGKMGELGAHTQEKHIEVGKAAQGTDVKVVIGVGEPAKDILAQIGDDKEQYYFENKDGLVEFLLNKVLQNNDIIFIKGSHYGSRVFEVAKELIEKGSQ